MILYNFFVGEQKFTSYFVLTLGGVAGDNVI